MKSDETELEAIIKENKIPSVQNVVFISESQCPKEMIEYEDLQKNSVIDDSLRGYDDLAGILIIAESEKVKGITQNKFINAAKYFEIDPSLLGDQPSPLAADKKTDTSIIDKDPDLPDADSVSPDEEDSDSPDSDDNPLLLSLIHISEPTRPY